MIRGGGGGFATRISSNVRPQPPGEGVTAGVADVLDSGILFPTDPAGILFPSDLAEPITVGVADLADAGIPCQIVSRGISSSHSR